VAPVSFVLDSVFKLIFTDGDEAVANAMWDALVKVVEPGEALVQDWKQ
jgi:hypothetical protein